MRIAAALLGLTLGVGTLAGAQPATPRLAFGEDGWVEPHGLFQIWTLSAFDDREPYARLGAARSSLRLRRAEVRFTGQTSDRVAFMVMFDPAKVLEFGTRNFAVAGETLPVLQPVSRVSVLQDIVLTFKHLSWAQISFGQLKTPLTYEGTSGSARLLFVERADLARIIGDQRDLGVWAHQKFRRVGYQVGVYNGAGANTLDVDSNKELIARFEGYLVEGLQIGVAGQRTLARHDRGTRTTFTGDVVFAKDPWSLQAEVAWMNAFSRAATPVATHTVGSYGAVGYKIPVGAVVLQPAVRFDWFEPSREIDGDDYWRATAGLNLLITGPETKVQLNYVHTGARGAKNDLLLLNVQAAF